MMSLSVASRMALQALPINKRHTQVHKALKSFGQWTEYSLFECFLTRKELLQMRAKLNQHLRAGEDRVRIYLICENCLPKIETIGIPQPIEDTSYLM